MNSFLAAAGSSININLGNSLSKPSTSVLVIIGLTLLAIAPSLLILLTGFTRIVIVFGLTRQALGLQSTPPNQVIAGLALIFSLFIMAPTLNQMNHDALQPYLHGKQTITQAYHSAQGPLKTWMLKQTGNEELALTTAVDKEHPDHAERCLARRHHPGLLAVRAEERLHHRLRHLHPLPHHRPRGVSTLMSMGVVMLPPTLVSLPFKLLLFVMVNGWVLVTHSLVVSFR